MAALTPEQATRLVMRLKPLPGEVRLVNRRKRKRVELSERSVSTLKAMRKHYRTATGAIEASLAAHRAELERPLLTHQARLALAYMQRLSDADNRELIELALRFAAQELKAGRTVAVI